MTSPRRTPVSRRDRPAKAPLTRDGIVAVAVRVLREEGLERVTMRRLAQELDTGPASLYVYVDGTAELHGAVLDQLLAAVDLRPPVERGTWRSDLAALLIAYTEVLFTHPSLARSVLTLRPAGPNYLRLVEAALALLRVGGVPTRQAAWGVDLLLQLATATAAEQGTRHEADDADLAEGAFALLLREVDAEEHPSIAWASGELYSGTGPERLRWAFAALTAGIARTRPVPTTNPSG